MSVRPYKSTVISKFITIWLLSFIISIISLVDFYDNSGSNKDRYRSAITISIPICIISGLIVLYEHNTNRNRNINYNDPV